MTEENIKPKSVSLSSGTSVRGKIPDQVNLEEMTESFNAWQSWSIDLEKETACLKVELESTKLLLVQADKNNISRKEEVEKIRSVVDNAHAAINTRTLLEEEKRKLQEKVAELEVQLTQQKSELEDKLTQCNTEIDDQKVAHAADLEQIKQEHSQAMKKRDAEVDVVLGDKQREMEALHKQLLQLEKDKQAEIIKLKLDYDGKLVKMKKQNAHLQTSSTNSSNQDIFRKKLQHVREESNKEITTLKRTISDLQHRLQQQQQQQQGGVSANSGLKRLKRY